MRPGEAMSLLYALRSCELQTSSEPTKLQVVEIGGACARRPAGLPLPEDVRWFSVNFPECATLKAERMTQAQENGSLQAAGYTTVHCHWLKGDLLEALRGRGWDPRVSTVWLCGPVLRTCDLRAAEVLLRAVAAGASATPCSALLAFPGHARGLPGYLSRHGWRRVQTLEAPGGSGQAVTAFGGVELERRMGG